jgi:hypothetical protein
MNVIAIAIETSTRAIATIPIAIETLGEAIDDLLCRVAFTARRLSGKSATVADWRTLLWQGDRRSMTARFTPLIPVASRPS